jgi:glycosyltransferase involved in cell wall biosynthesis
LAGITLDAVHSFSGVSEELFRAIKPLGPVKSLVRGSSHIRTQARLLAMEEARCGRRINRPSEWMIQRETLEYELADLVIVLSSFCRESFLQEGFADQKLKVLIPGNEVKRFRPTRQVIDERCERITRGDPLRVLMVGTFSYRKGVLDLAAIADRLGRRMTFRFVGDILPEARNLRARLKDRIEFLPRQPQFSLSEIYKWGDIFVFPTIEEGFPTVLSQAAASGLPILSTPNGAGTDLIQNDRTGWVLPIQSPQEFIDRLIWCDQHRREFATMVRDIYEGFRSRDWSDMAADLIEIYYQCMAKKAAK